MPVDDFQKDLNKVISHCLFCNKKIVDNKGIRKSICLNCMAYIIHKIDIQPHRDYQQFIDFAYESRHRLLDGEKPEVIFQNLPNGFEEWLQNNFIKTGYGVTSDE